MLNTVFFPARASAFKGPHVTCRQTWLKCALEELKRGYAKKKERAQDCIWHVFGQVGYLCGHLDISLWQEGKITVQCFLLHSVHDSTSKSFMLFFYSVIWVIRISYYLCHVSSAVFDALELPYVSTWCLSGTVGESGRSTLMPLMQENVSLTQMAFLKKSMF